MKICQVNPGIIEIPPKGWGAIEKIIWNYQKCFQKMGAQCDIKYLSEISAGSGYDIVHIHVANLAIEARKRGIPYIFSLHDHHVFRYGKKSWLYEQNMEAIKGSIFSFAHAEFLVDFFDATDKLFYLPHGVDTSLYSPNSKKRKDEHKLLCLANNGFCDAPAEDRKGFRPAIEAAKMLGLPITIVGPDQNNNFFSENPDLLKYERLNLVLTNPEESEIIDLYRSHSIFLHPSSLEAGHPNLTILEAISCGIPIVGTYEGTRKFKSIVKSSIDSKDLASRIEYCMQNYEKISEEILKERNTVDWSVICSDLYKLYVSFLSSKKSLKSTDVSKNLVSCIETTEKNPKDYLISETFSVNFIGGAFCEIRGNYPGNYRVEFLDKSGNVEYSTEIGSNMWTRLNKKYLFESTINVFRDNSLVFTEKFNPRGKKVLISLESKALGDTLAWFPYIDEFRKKYECDVVCSTFWNDLFKDNYREIDFVNPGTVVSGIYAMYSLGWFYKDGIFDLDRNPGDFRKIPLQKTASDILGLEYREIKPLVKFTRKKKSRKVGIGIHSTAQAKYWNNPGGWQEVVDFLKSEGYEVVLYSKEEDGYMGNKNPEGVSKFPVGDIFSLMEDMSSCEFFIGIGSGLSWLAWSLDLPIFLISGFSEEYSEMTQGVHRIINKKGCYGCFNTHRLDPSDWNWCPLHKNTERQFECTKEISPSMVIDRINTFLHSEKECI